MPDPTLPAPLRLRDVMHHMETTVLDEGGRFAGPSTPWLLVFWIMVWVAGYAGTMALLAAGSWWAVAVAAPLAGVTLMLSLGFMHEGSHKSIGKGRALSNRLANNTLTLFGVSPGMWRLQHVVNHHTHTNVPGKDPDIEVAPFFRFHEGQRYHAWHRVQHWYAPVLYSLLVLKWLWWSDFHGLIKNIYGVDRRQWWWLFAEIVGTRLLHIALWIVLPIWLGAPVLILAVAYLTLWLIVGLVLSLVFQAAHIGSVQAFPEDEAGQKNPLEHQLATTADFAAGSWFLTEIFGGLNLQVEHHLFPHVHHRHLRRIHQELRRIVTEHGLTVHSYPTFWAAICAHFAHLRRLARPEPQPVPVRA